MGRTTSCMYIVYCICTAAAAAFFLLACSSYLCVHKFNHWKYTDTTIHFTDKYTHTTQNHFIFYRLSNQNQISFIFFLCSMAPFFIKLYVGVILWPKMLHSRICIFVYSLLNGLSLLSCIFFLWKKRTALSLFSGHQVGGERETVVVTLTILLTNCPFCCCCTHHLKLSNALGTYIYWINLNGRHNDIIKNYWKHLEFSIKPFMPIDCLYKNWIDLNWRDDENHHISFEMHGVNKLSVLNCLLQWEQIPVQEFPPGFAYVFVLLG